MKKQGFSLIELMIVLFIVGILATISISLYTSNIRKGRRIDAINTLLSMSLAEEKYRSNNTQYGTLAQVWSGVTTTSGGFYTLAVSNVAGTTYTITATPVGNQVNDTQDGVSCNPIQLLMSSGTISRTPAACWPK